MFLITALLLLLSQAPARVHTLTGNIQTNRVADRDIIVYLPPDYETVPTRRYPVLYLQDGQNVFDGATSFIAGKEWQADETAERLIRAGQIEPLIIVGIYNVGATRMEDYSPVPDPKYGGGKADAYGRLILDELKPFIDKNYRTNPLRTGIGGSSLGGLLALYLGLTHPDVFQCVLAASPSTWWAGGDIIRRVRALQTKPQIRIWLDTGTKEGDTPDVFVHDDRELRDALIAKGWKAGIDLQYMEAEGAEHNESAWAARFPEMLKFLYPKKP